MNSLKQSSFTCSNCKKPFLFLILPNKNKIYKHCRQCGKDLYSCIDRFLSTDIYNDTSSNYFCSTCNEHYQFAQNHNRICIRKKISIQKDIYFCIDTLIKGYESNKSNYYLTTNLLNNIHFNNIDFDSVIKSKYSFISAVNSFSIIEQNLTESSFKK